MILRRKGLWTNLGETKLMKQPLALPDTKLDIVLLKDKVRQRWSIPNIVTI